MPENVLVGILALLGTMIGTFGGIITSSKLTNYRLEQLEAKVEKHNNFAEKIPVIRAELQEHKAKLEHLEKYHTERI